MVRPRAGRVVVAANEMNLGERVEHGARRFVKLDGAANVERAVQGILRSPQISEAHADLTERGQRHGQPVARAVRFVERYASLGQRQRLLVAVLQHHHVGLVPADHRQDVVGLHERRETLGLSERPHGFVVAAQLRERDAGQRMHQREVAAIAGGVKR